MNTSVRPHILLIDDDAAVRGTLARVLATDFMVTEAVDGLAAIRRLEAETFDVVLTDLEMPGAGGDDVVAWLERHRPVLAARCLVLSGGARAAPRAAWLAAFDPKRVLHKPCSIEVITAAIREVLG